MPILARTVQTTTHGRFLIDVPRATVPHPLLVGFHGYGENAERHLEQLRQIPGASRWLLVSVQGLHRFYNARMEEVVASWMTRQDREDAIADNLVYVNRVVNAVRSDYQTNGLVFAGFSQGAAMAYRAALLGLSRADGIIALGGDVPPDVRDRPAPDFPPVLLGRGTRDTWYTDEKLQADIGHLQSIGVAVQSVVLDAGHEWTDEFRQAVGEFLQSIAARV